MRLSPQLLSLALLAAAGTGAWAKPAYVTSTVNLRAAPGTDNEIVAKIPGGSLVDADNCTDGWCAVTWQDKSGFAIQSVIDTSGRVPPPRRVAAPPPPGPPPYADGPVYIETPPPPPAVYYAPRRYYYGPYYPRYYGWRRW